MVKLDHNGELVWFCMVLEEINSKGYSKFMKIKSEPHRLKPPKAHLAPEAVAMVMQHSCDSAHRRQLEVYFKGNSNFSSFHICMLLSVNHYKCEISTTY